MPARPPATDDTLKRVRAGTYRTRDGRFTVEQSSSGWLVYDAEQTDELGLPLARGPFPTLDDARAALPDAREAPAPSSRLARAEKKAPGERAPKAASRPTLVPPRQKSRGHAGKATASHAGDISPRNTDRAAARPVRPVKTAPPPKPAIVVRDIRAVDGEALRALWTSSGFGTLGDDDLGLARMARRNPGLVLVAAEGSRVVGSALGAWDGRRGWIYHVAVAASHRRQGIATRLIDQVEAGLRSLGCRKVNVMVRPDSDGGAEFWAARGYEVSEARQYGRELDPD